MVEINSMFLIHFLTILITFGMVPNRAETAQTIIVESSSSVLGEDEPLQISCRVRSDNSKPQIQYIHIPSGEDDALGRVNYNEGVVGLRGGSPEKRAQEKKEVDINSELWPKTKFSYEEKDGVHVFKVDIPAQKTKLHLRLKNESLIICEVVRTYPLPRVRVFLAGSDYTDWFDRFVSLSRDEGGKSFYYDMAISSKYLRITPSDDHKKVKCQVDYPSVARKLGASERLYVGEVSHTIDLVDYKPTIECEDDRGTLRARLHEQTFQLNCSISSKPKLSYSAISWPRLTKGREVLEVGSQLGNYQVLLFDDENNSNTQNFIFRIMHIYPQHFRKYLIEARNMEGGSFYEVDLKESEWVVRSLQRGSSSSTWFPTDPQRSEKRSVIIIITAVVIIIITIDVIVIVPVATDDVTVE
ncbi:hypothetical protein HELRODRAFT_183814 [Helobdella robusta]|uniref:Ig-like domain-containing protein n=1 Tax=Helobdella robusta TaxID=6412 RepID=T1FK85_HELRO|nr:hypothetical protein HELRODRAFT_183814 [Helobdella robusta]ESO09814.1 hypothetical protein HELRODRAFT_183814 [Helobdella robusta]